MTQQADLGGRDVRGGNVYRSNLNVRAGRFGGRGVLSNVCGAVV